MGNTTKYRESNYDLLRLICTVAVILIHVANYFLKASFRTYSKDIGFLFTGSLLATVVFDTLPRFAVQCFVMLSGAFNLDDKRNADYKYFYHKAFKKIGITGMVFSVAYTVYELIKITLKRTLIITGGGIFCSQ